MEEDEMQALPEGTEVPEQQEEPQQEKLQSSALPKQLGNIDVKGELLRLQKESFTNLNTSRILDRYTGTLRVLDTAVGNGMYYVSEYKKQIDKVKNNPEVRGQTWSATDNIWYGAVMNYEEQIKHYNSVLAAKDWEISFLQEMVNKMEDLIKTFQEAGAEEIRFKTAAAQTESNSKFMQDMLKIQADQSKQALDSATKNSETLLKAFADSVQGVIKSSLGKKVVDEKEVKAQGRPSTSAPQANMPEAPRPSSFNEKEQEKLEAAVRERWITIMQKFPPGTKIELTKMPVALKFRDLGIAGSDDYLKNRVKELIRKHNFEVESANFSQDNEDDE